MKTLILLSFLFSNLIPAQDEASSLRAAFIAAKEEEALFRKKFEESLTHLGMEIITGVLEDIEPLVIRWYEQNPNIRHYTVSPLVLLMNCENDTSFLTYKKQLYRSLPRLNVADLNAIILAMVKADKTPCSELLIEKSKEAELIFEVIRVLGKLGIQQNFSQKQLEILSLNAYERGAPRLWTSEECAKERQREERALKELLATLPNS